MISILGSNISENQSLTNNSSNFTLFHRLTTVQVCILCLLLPIPIFAIVGNLFIMTAVARFQHLRTPTDAFMFSLAVADFLVAVLVMPFSLVQTIDGWHFGRCFCRAHFLLDVAFCTSSIFNLSCVALDRYIAVCDPLHYHARMSPRRVAKLLLLCWILPVVFASLCVSLGLDTQLPPVVLNSSTQQGIQICKTTFNVPCAFVTSTISFFIPMGFMLFAYGNIFIAAYKQARWIHSIEHQTGHLQMNLNTMRTNSSRQVQAHTENYSLKKERKAARTVGVIMGVFLMCWFPFFCMNIIHPLKGHSTSHLILEAARWLGYANSSVNPFLYALFNKNYRHIFVSMLGCGIMSRQLPGLDFSHCGKRQTNPAVILETISR